MIRGPTVAAKTNALHPALLHSSAPDECRYRQAVSATFIAKIAAVTDVFHNSTFFSPKNRVRSLSYTTRLMCAHVLGLNANLNTLHISIYIPKWFLELPMSIWMR